jgi:ABC-type amino acid transport substrate-binding protein
VDTIDTPIHNIPPWGYINNTTNRFEGIYIDTLEELQRRTGIAFDISVIPLKRVTKNLSDGKADFSIIFERQSFKDEVVNLGPIVQLNIYLVRKVGELDIRQLLITRGEEEIADKLISTLKLKNIEKTFTNNHPTNIIMLQLNRGDAAILVGENHLSDLHEKLPGFVCEIIEVKTAFAFLHKKSKFNQPEITSKISTAIDNMWNDGFIKRNNTGIFDSSPNCLVQG